MRVQIPLPPLLYTAVKFVDREIRGTLALGVVGRECLPMGAEHWIHCVDALLAVVLLSGVVSGWLI